MFGFGRVRKEATAVGTAAARLAILPFWDLFARAFDTRIWSDPYLLGLIQGSATAQTLPFTGRNLSTTDKGFVILNAMRNLGASDAAIEFSMALNIDKGSDFMRGYDDAIVTFLIMGGALKEEAYSEPDVIAAREAMSDFDEMDALINGFDTRTLGEKHGAAFIYLKVNRHKRDHYPSTV